MSTAFPGKFLLTRNLWLMLACVLATAPLVAQTYHELYDFDCSIGCGPYDIGRLVQGKDGYFYGTGYAGGADNHGTIFKIDSTGLSHIDLHDFNGTTDGYSPAAGLALSSVDGNFYGTTIGGGTYNSGTLYQFNASTSTFVVVHDFTTAEGSPDGPPVEAKDGNLYGVTEPGGVYSLQVKTQSYSLLPNKTPNGPNGPLLPASDGNLYGTTSLGGQNNMGTIFRMTLKGQIQVIHNFAGGSEGEEPSSALIQDKSGVFYGTTVFEGGTSDAGTIFKFTTGPFVLSTLHVFGPGDGGRPVAALLQATDGNFYGTGSDGGANLEGTIFDISGGTFNKLFDFADPGESGVAGDSPYTGLVEGTDGALYGLTEAGGSSFQGVFYSITLPNISGNITLCCNYWVILDQPVTILGQNLTGVISVSFGGAAAQFRVGSGTYLTAKVPSAALDGPVVVTLATGLQLQSQQSAHILPRITNLDPSAGPVGTPVNITGGGFSRTSKVTFGGVATGNFEVLSPSLIQATVPSGAPTGKVVVVTPNGSATSKAAFTVN